MEDVANWRLRSSAGLPYRVIKGGEGQVSYEDANIREVYLIQASDLFAWMTDAFPEPFVYAGTLQYPQQPVLPGLGTLVPKRLTFKSFEPTLPTDPFGADGDAPTGTYSEFMELTVDYGSAAENQEQQDPSNPFTFLQVSSNASGVFLNSPMEKGAEWVLPAWAEEENTAPDPITGEDVTTGESTEVTEKSIPHVVTESSVEWNVSWPNIPFIFWDETLVTRMRDKLGKVNDDVLPLFQNAPAETILFMSYSMSTSWTWRENRTGQSPIQLSMKFVEKNFKGPGGQGNEVDVAHQHLYRPNYGYRKLKINDDFMYRITDLNKIWSP